MRSGGQGFDLQQPPRKWFGTDGIRGVANVDLPPELAVRAGRAAAAVLGGGAAARLLIGRDTRLSGPMIEGALVAGITSMGGTAILAGVVPTPAVSRLVAVAGEVSGGPYHGGVVISASHNPYEDNGVKLFGPDGKKLPDDVEARVEAAMESLGETGVSGAGVGGAEPLPAAGPRYVEDLLSALSVDLAGCRVLLDCGHGATYRTSPLAFQLAGAHVETLCADPDGMNINAGCGSTHLEYLAARVVQGDYHLGLAFDGDGDRVLAVDPTGRAVDGDQILAILAPWLKEQGRLRNDTVVVTSMSNLGFHRAMRERGIRVEVTDVGDRYVLERMEQVPAVLGGEQSGHVIALDVGATGDGLQTGLLLCQALVASGAGLEALAATMRRFPQLLVNVRVGDKSRLRDASEVWEAVAAEEASLGDEGRVVLRPSGTEPLVRVMVEAATEERCRAVADRLIQTVQRALA
ncbi:MAG: phosphoglucosamine mutase [Thermoleophilia bacterium]